MVLARLDIIIFRRSALHDVSLGGCIRDQLFSDDGPIPLARKIAYGETMVQHVGMVCFCKKEIN